MRWKLLRRRWSISAPRMIVRRHLPWPLRWVVVALMLGFCAAVALWAFEFGKEIAGLDPQSKVELQRLRLEVAQLRDERDKAQAIANTAESLLKAESVAREQMSQQLREVEADNLELKADLGFFERLLPAAGTEGVMVRSLQADIKAPGKLRYQVLVMQNGKSIGTFAGAYSISLAGTLDGRPWSLAPASRPQTIQLKRYLRVEGMIDFPERAVVQTVQARVLDAKGSVLVTQSVSP